MEPYPIITALTDHRLPLLISIIMDFGSREDAKTRRNSRKGDSVLFFSSSWLRAFV
jgi:hypothetical protein